VDFGGDERMLAAALNIRARLGPMSIPATPKPGGSVSLCMIVKNEQDHLARCLRSVKPLVDEMIVVDTGSSDYTLDMPASSAPGIRLSLENDFRPGIFRFPKRQGIGSWCWMPMRRFRLKTTRSSKIY
jgi:hypothetical protein